MRVLVMPRLYLNESTHMEQSAVYNVRIGSAVQNTIESDLIDSTSGPISAYAMHVDVSAAP